MGGGGGNGDAPPMDNNSPSGVTIRGGRMRASTPTSSVDRTRDRQVEEKATIAGKTFGAMNVSQRRDLAIKQLEGRLKNPQIKVAGVGTAISGVNLRNQIKALKAGGVANFVRSDTGKYVAVGVTTEEGGTLGREGDISGMTVRKAEAPSTTGEDEQPALTGGADEDAPSDPETSGTLMTPKSTKRRTRGKRFGGAANFEEGILVKSKR